jgi:RNA ligase
MKINLSNYDLTNFHLNEGIFCGDYTTLVVPKMLGCNWTQDNKIFRSSIWDYEGNLVSAGLPKFTNFGENPEHFPVPKSLDNCIIVDKIDGSLCIIDYYKDTFSMRTRGTFSIDNAENISDFHYCITKYPRIKEWIKQNSQHSLLCEITTPNQKIVIDYGAEPDFWLIGAVNKNDYSLMTQQELDNLSKLLGVKRPDYYQFSSMDSLLESIKKMIGKEGCCLYSRNQQYIHKIKSEKYLALHHMKSELSNIEKVMDVWLEQKMPDYNTFYTYIVNSFDFELAEQCRGHISNLCDGRKEVDKIIDHMRGFINSKVRHLPSRKEQALTILNSYGETNRSGYLFKILDNKPLEKDDYKKLMFQVMKK